MKKTLFNRRILSKAMRVTVTQLVVAFLFCGLSFAGDTNAQEILDKEVSLQMPAATLKKVLSSIEKQVSVSFVYSTNSIGAQQTVSVNVTKGKLSKLLDELLPPLKISYEVIGSRILLRKNSPDQSAIPTIDVLPGFNAPKAAQSVTGTVTSEAGETLPGVNILLKGTTTGTTTDSDGKYSISLPDGNGTLVA